MKLCLALVFSSLFLASCSERVGSGAQVDAPVVTFNCTTTKCRANPTATAFIRITQSSCNPSFDNLATAAWSGNITCMNSGCYAITTGWVNTKGEILAKIPSGPYTICGRVDFNRNYPVTTGDDATAVSESVSVGDNSQQISLTNWVDP